MNNQAWYEAKWWHTLYNQPTDERLHVAICNGLRSMQDKLDQTKDEDYCMVSNETFLVDYYLYHLETEDRQERAEKQKLKEPQGCRSSGNWLYPKEG
jgi:hypothetical protein